MTRLDRFWLRVSLALLVTLSLGLARCGGGTRQL